MNLFEKNLSSLEIAPIIDFGFPDSNYRIFDFSENNSGLESLNLNDQKQFEGYINQSLKKEKALFGIGKYAEDRILYRRFNLFSDENPRSFHLGIDIWQNAGTAVYAPVSGTIHSFKNNSNIGDYGPTIILEHQFGELHFYTLYGHLSLESIENLFVGKQINTGEKFCALGTWEINVNWPPHLHFQIIRDLGNYNGDFPGVCSVSEKNKWMENCPNPNVLLRIPGLV